MGEKILNVWHVENYCFVLRKFGTPEHVPSTNFQKLRDDEYHGALELDARRLAAIVVVRLVVVPHRFREGRHRFTFFMAAGALYLALTLVSNVIIGRIERWSRRGMPSVAGGAQ